MPKTLNQHFYDAIISNNLGSVLMQIKILESSLEAKNANWQQPDFHIMDLAEEPGINIKIRIAVQAYAAWAQLKINPGQVPAGEAEPLQKVFSKIMNSGSIELNKQM